MLPLRLLDAAGTLRAWRGGPVLASAGCSGHQPPLSLRGAPHGFRVRTASTLPHSLVLAWASRVELLREAR
jgi:hypothetical protein